MVDSDRTLELAEKAGYDGPGLYVCNCPGCESEGPDVVPFVIMPRVVKGRKTLITFGYREDGNHFEVYKLYAVRRVV